MPATQTAKVCVLCGRDCFGRPRVKNSQGKYACKSCLEERRARADEAFVLSPDPKEGVERAARRVPASLADAVSEPELRPVDEVELKPFEDGDPGYDEGLGGVLEDIRLDDPSIRAAAPGALREQAHCPGCEAAVLDG